MKIKKLLKTNALKSNFSSDRWFTTVLCVLKVTYVNHFKNKVEISYSLKKVIKTKPFIDFEASKNFMIIKFIFQKNTIKHMKKSIYMLIIMNDTCIKM